MDIKECYRVLELAIGAPRDAVETAYCRLLERWHPDRVTPAGDPAAVREATRMVQVVNEAYQTLMKIAPASTETKPAPGRPTSEPAPTSNQPARVKPTFTPPPAPPRTPPPPAFAPTPPPLPGSPAVHGVPGTIAPAQAAGQTPGVQQGTTGSQQREAGNGAPAPVAVTAASPDYWAKAKAIYDKLFPPGTPQRRWGPVAVAVPLLIILLLAKCAVSSVGEKISAVSQAHADAKRMRTTGVLIVKSNRPEATIEATRIAAAGDTAADSAKGALGQALSGLMPGKYAVTVHADGWPDARGEVDVTAGQQTNVAINFKNGSLRLDSDPAGATVRLGEAVLGKTPLVIPQLPPGECPLSLEYPTWPAMSFKTTITENVESTETVRLPHGKLTVESTPSGAMVLVGARPIGQTPLTLERVPAGINKLTLQAKGFPPLKVSVTVDDRGEVNVSRELGSGFPELDPSALLQAVWVPDDPNKLSPGVDSLGPYEPRNGIVRNLHRKRLYENWLRKSYRYSAVIKSYDRDSGQVEFAEQYNEYSKYRVLAKLSSTARNDKDLAARLTKGATFTLYGRLSAVEEARWLSKLITLEISAAEPLH